MNNIRRLYNSIWILRYPESCPHIVQKSSFSISTKHYFHYTSSSETSKSDIDKFSELKALDLFDEIAAKKEVVNKQDFKTAIAMYLDRESVYRRGSVEFVHSALSQMKKYGVLRDLASYKSLLFVFPEKTMVPTSSWQSEMMHYPKQQNCAIDIMEQMERNGVIPDQQFGELLYDRFGDSSHAFRKYRRITYWLPKFKHANPYPVPETLPDFGIELAKLALKRMCIDNQNEVTVWETKGFEAEPLENTFIVSAMSPGQRKLITKHPVNQPLFVEGYFNTWLRYMNLYYFILRADPDVEKFKKLNEPEDDAELFNWDSIFEEEHSTLYKNKISMHEQEDGTILGMCITGTASKNSVMTWIQYLQEANPHLTKVPIVFSIRTPLDDTELVDLSLPKNSTTHIEDK